MTIKVTGKTYNAKFELRLVGFCWDATSKTWLAEKDAINWDKWAECCHLTWGKSSDYCRPLQFEEV